MTNPHPLPEHQFKPGQSGNPGGKTSQQRKNEIRASELASQMTVEMMETFVELAGVSDGVEKARLLSSDLINLIKEANNRAHGSPKSSVDLTSEDGSMSPPSVIQITGKQDDDG